VFQPIFRDPLDNDLTLVFIGARIGLEHGWSHIYSLDLQHQLWNRSGPALRSVTASAFCHRPPPPGSVVPLTVLGARALSTSDGAVGGAVSWPVAGGAWVWLSWPGLLAALSWYPLLYSLSPGACTLVVLAVCAQLVACGGRTTCPRGHRPRPLDDQTAAHALCRGAPCSWTVALALAWAATAASWLPCPSS
jgi:hypothetical protein